MTLFLVIVPIVLYYLTMLFQQLARKWWDGQLSKKITPLGGGLAWLWVSLATSYILMMVLAFVDFLSGKLFVAIESIPILILGALYIPLGFKIDEMLSENGTREFLRASLIFENYATRREDIFEELERHMIREIHRETSNLPFPTARTKWTGKTEEELELIRRAILESRNKPIESLHLAQELKALSQNNDADITDSFKHNSMRKLPHAYASHVTFAKVYPSSGLFELRLDVSRLPHWSKPEIHADWAKRDLRKFFQRLFSIAWMQPYIRYFDHITVECFRIEMDDLAMEHTIPVLTLKITPSEFATERAAANRSLN